MRALGAVVAAALLAACAAEPGPAPSPGASAAGAAGPEAAGAVAEYRQMVEELRRASRCVNAVEQEPRFQPLQVRTPSGPAPHGLHYFTDPARATPAEAALTQSFVTALVDCRPFFGELRERVHRAIARQIVATWEADQMLYGDLRAGKLTWGAFNLETKAHADRLRGALEALRDASPGSAGPGNDHP